MTPGRASRIIASAELLKMKPRFEVRTSAEGSRAKGRKGLGLVQTLERKHDWKAWGGVFKMQTLEADHGQDHTL